jgi:putative endonuclease
MSDGTQRRGGPPASQIRGRGRAHPYNALVPYVYILRCGDGSLYTGIAKDLARRLEQHQRGSASKYTRAHLPVTLVWKRRVLSWSRALREEYRIKTLTRDQKEQLVAAARPPR